jgi:hypothetical protein
MITIQMTKIACESREIAQTMKPPVIKLLVDEWIVLLGRSAIRFLITPKSTAVVTVESIPNTPLNPANKYVCCFPCPRSWICAPFR